MRPKEKSIELVGNYQIKVNVLYTEDSVPAVMNAPMTFNSSKECALIAVKEMLSVLKKEDLLENLEDWIHYFENVKTEIENL
jgi:hypothetical protein